MDYLPPILDKFLTVSAWRSICEIVRDSFPQNEDGTQAVMKQLAMFYPALQFTLFIAHSSENRSENVRYNVRIDTANSVRAVIPEGVAPGEEFTVIDPVSGNTAQVRAPEVKASQIDVSIPRAPPLSPMTAATVIVPVPEGKKEGETITFTHPDDGREITTTVPHGRLQGITVTCR